MMSQHTGNGFAGTDTFVPYWSLAVVALVLKSVGLTPQLAISGLVLALAYVGVYCLAISILPRTSSFSSRTAAAIGGSVAALAPLVAETFWTNFEPRLYLLPLVPWLTYAILQYIRLGLTKYLVAGTAMTIVASAGIADIPGCLPAFLLIVLFIIVIGVNEHLASWKSFRRGAIFLTVILLANAYWLLPFTVVLAAGQAQALYSTSQTGQQAALSLVAALVPYQQLSSALGLRISELMMQSFGWSQLSFSSWYQRWSLVGYLPIAVALGGVVARISTFKERRGARIPLVGMLVVALVMLGFVSLVFPPGARQLFDFMTVHVPGWVAEKNFYETFAIPYVVAVALACAIGFYALASVLSRGAIVSIGLAVTALFGIYGSPLLLGSPFRNPYNNLSPANRVLSSLPHGYTSLVSRITQSGDAPTLSLPLLQPAWTYLVGRSANNGSSTYIGIPPLYYVYGVTDYTGVSSFDSSVAPNLAVNLQSAVSIGDAKTFSRVVRLVGVHWIISDLFAARQTDFQTVDSQSTPATSVSFALAVEHDLRATEVARMGGYRLLRVPSDYSSPVISIDRFTAFSSSSQGISRVAAGFYRGPLRRACPNVVGGQSLGATSEVSLTVTGDVPPDSCFVALRTPYTSLSGATMSTGGRTVALEHREAYGFANGFVLPHLGRGRLIITFSNSASSDDAIGVGISLVACLLLLSSPLVAQRSRRRRQPDNASERESA
jgi:hypothetical protein